jgi:hypothetical protein
MNHDVQTNEITTSPDAGFDRQSLYQKALELSSIFSGDSVVEKIGLYGSLSRKDKPPTDIDLLIFVKDQALVRKIMIIRTDEAKDQPTIKDPEGHLEEEFFACLSDSSRFKLFFALLNRNPQHGSIRQYPVDYFLVPYPLSNRYIEIESLANKDPLFLNHVAHEVLIYQPSDNHFVKQEIFTPHQIELIKQRSGGLSS